MKKLKIITMCSGYDSQCMALDRLKSIIPGFDYELVAWAEIDPNAIVSHNAVFPQYRDRNLGDITKVDWEKVPDTFVIFGSTPCQSFSKSGKNEGGKKDSGTESSIIWNVVDAVKAKRPAVFILENVDNLPHKHIADFKEWKAEVEALGYTSTWKILDSSDYGVPQGRKRVILIAVRDDMCAGLPYMFPEEKHQMRDIDSYLDNDAKDYLSREDTAAFLSVIKQLASCSYDSQMPLLTDETVEVTIPCDKGRRVARFVSPTTQSGLVPTLTATVGTRSSFLSFVSTGRYPKPCVVEVWESDTFQKKTVNVHIKKYTNTFKRRIYNNSLDKILDISKNLKENQRIRIRPLTSKEYLALMGVNGSDYMKMIAAGVSDAEICKQAGNSIVVDVLVYVFKQVILNIFSKQNITSELQNAA